MKNSIKVIAFVLFTSAKLAAAIVIVPPIVYIVTFSAGTYMFNVLIMTSAYMASKGIVDRFYFKRPMHEIVGIIFSYIGSILVIISTSFISIAIFDPIETRSLFNASVFSAFLGFFIISLSNFRKYTLIDEIGRNAILRSAVVFSIFVFAITFASAYFAISTKTLRRESSIINVPMQENRRSMEAESEFGLNAAPKAKMDATSTERKDSYKQEAIYVRSLWFSPYKEGTCDIYAGNTLVKTQKSSGKCFFYDNKGEMKRMACPISIDVNEISISKYENTSTVPFEGRGSCVEKYDVAVSKNGFLIK